MESRSRWAMYSGSGLGMLIVRPTYMLIRF